MGNFQMDQRLHNDTIFVADLPLSTLTLMNDRRWPWLILVPRIADGVEIHDLAPQDQQELARETALCAKMLKDLTGCKKINSGSLGNVVSQLHVHVIARNEGDPNWPAPVWGFGERVPYPPEEAEELVAQLARAIA